MKEYRNINGVPDFDCSVLKEKNSVYALLIPIINEGSRIETELQKAQTAGIDKICDIIICDGGSTEAAPKPMRCGALALRHCLLSAAPANRARSCVAASITPLKTATAAFLQLTATIRTASKAYRYLSKSLKRGMTLFRAAAL